MNSEPTNKDLFDFMGKMAEDMESGFSNTREHFTGIRADIANVREDIAKIDDRLVAVEAKIDRALFKEIDRLDAEIKKIKEHVGL